MISLRAATAEDMGILRQMYAELLGVLIQYNPTVDPAHELQRDWIEKPGDLFAWLIERGADSPETVGFALVCGERYAHALGASTEYMLYEFLVTEPARRSGIGQQALSLLWEEQPGTWSLDVLPGNTPAMEFWSRALGPFAPARNERIDDDGVTFVRFAFTAPGAAR